MHILDIYNDNVLNAFNISKYNGVLSIKCVHWNGNVILTKFSSLAASEIVKMKIFGVANDENSVKMATSLTHWF